MSNSKVRLGLIAPLACALFFLLIIINNRITVFTTNPQNQKSEASSGQKFEAEFVNSQNPETLETLETVSPPLKIQSEYSRFYEELRSNPFKRSAYREFCGDNPDQIANSLQKIFKLSELNSEQQLVVENLLEKCKVLLNGDANGDWSAAGRETTSSVEEKLADLLILQDPSQENTSIAKELLTSEDADLVIKSVAILLTRDEEFQRIVSNAAGSASSAYARSAMGEIVPMLTCNLEGDCGPDSAIMIGFCLSNKDACGKDIYDFVRTVHSPNYVEDVSKMASAIYEARMSLLVD